MSKMTQAQEIKWNRKQNKSERAEKKKKEKGNTHIDFNWSTK